jgi:polar amino acid transport system substrate-binding protein
MKKSASLPLFKCLTFALLLAGAVPVGQAQTTNLVVGTRESPPYAMKNGAGNWEGLCVELFRAVATDIGMQCEFREETLETMLTKAAAGELDAAAAALTITAERERDVDFTHPFASTGLGIAVRDQGRGMNWAGLLRGLFSPAFLKAVAALCLVLLAAGVGIWFFERRRNPEQFGGRTLTGLGNGFWWSAVTMTTVGYGDRAPVTLGGRIVALIWMFTSIIIISGFTAAMASSLTVESMDGPIRSPADLPRHRVAALEDSTSAEYLREHGVATITFPTVADALRAVMDGRVDAAVHDAPILRYVTRDQAELQVLPVTFHRQDYGFALPPGSELRQPINIALLKRLSSGWWEDLQKRYLGPDAAP